MFQGDSRERSKERLLLAVIYKVNPAKNDPKLNYVLF